MLAIGVLAATAALVLGLRFSVITLVLLTLAIVIVFATGVLGGRSPLVVGLQMLATLASVQISYLFGCVLAAHLPLRAKRPAERMQMRYYQRARLRADPPLHLAGGAPAAASARVAPPWPKPRLQAYLGQSIYPINRAAITTSRQAASRTSSAKVPACRHS
jgi:hypothetical protein